MAATVTGIIYGEKSGIVRRIIVPDDDAQLAAHVGPGEALLTIPRNDPRDVHSATAAVAAATGKDIPPSRCAMVDSKGAVVGIIAADPVLDSIDGHDLVTVHAKGVDIGATYDKNADAFTTRETIIPAGTPIKGGTVTTEDQVVGGEVVTNVYVAPAEASP